MNYFWIKTIQKMLIFSTSFACLVKSLRKMNSVAFVTEMYMVAHCLGFLFLSYNSEMDCFENIHWQVIVRLIIQL